MLGVDVEKMIKPVTEEIEKFTVLMSEMNGKLIEILDVLNDISEKLDNQG